MRVYLHKPDTKALTENRASDRTKYERRAAKIPEAVAERNQNLLHSTWQYAVIVAAEEYAFSAPISHVKTLLAASCDYAEKALDAGLVLNPALYQDYLGLANLCGDLAFRVRLEGMKRSMYSDPDIGSDELHFLVAEMMSDLSASRSKQAKEKLPRAEARCMAKSLPPEVRRFLAPEIELIKAILDKDARALDTAVTKKIDQHVKSYSRPDVNNYPQGLIDLTALAYLKIAGRHGLTTSIQNVYVPKELLEGDPWATS